MEASILGETTQRILSTIQSADDVLSLRDIEKKMSDIRPDMIRVTLSRLTKNEHIVRLSRGKYCSIEYAAKRRSSIKPDVPLIDTHL